MELLSRTSIQVFLISFLFGASFAVAADHITLLTHPARSPQQQRLEAPKPKTLSGPEFSIHEPKVVALIKVLGDAHEIQDFGPDSAFVTADIQYRDARYKLHSWYPLNCGNPKIAISETRGLVFVSEAEEKSKIESSNSKRYQVQMKFWNSVMPCR